ncbi:hypothetical protein [Runella sp.]|uniref:hypothetical protein n=1 Tax=Runella sp. TaxID=1960881 RepID=UPI003D14614D
MAEINIESELTKIALKAIDNGIQYKQYLYCENPKNVDLLFVGLNPSEEKNIEVNHLEITPQNPTVVEHSYFKRFQEVSKESTLKWGHLDLLYFRDTNQANVSKIAYRTGNIGKQFILSQLELSLELIKNINPQIIVICNSLARDFFTSHFNQADNWLQQPIKFEENLGTYRWDWNNTPIFFTSMLTGQRALDTGSYERLIWHIKYVNEIIL